jgi:hypothetical protein
MVQRLIASSLALLEISEDLVIDAYGSESKESDSGKSESGETGEWK